MTKPECRNPREARWPVAAGRPSRFFGMAGAMVTAAMLSSCGTVRLASRSGHYGPDQYITVSQLDAARRMPELKFSKVRVALRVRRANQPAGTDLPAVVARRGQPVTVEQTGAFPYPADFEFAKVTPVPPGSSYPVTPTTPRGFTSGKTGISVALTADARGPFLLLRGTVTEATAEVPAANPGLIFSPIVTDDRKVVLTDNKCLSPRFTSRVTHFHIAALPGQTLSLPLNSSQKGRIMDITAVLPDHHDYRVVAPLNLSHSFPP